MATQVYRVVRQCAYWYVAHEGMQRPSRGYRSRENAIARAMDLASTHRPSVVRIENSLGDVEIERTFGRPAGFDKSA